MYNPRRGGAFIKKYEWRGPKVRVIIEKALERKLETTLQICVRNTKEHIREINLWDTGDLHDSIRYWGPEHKGRYIIGRFGVPKTYGGHSMDYAVYQDLGFEHYKTGQFIQNEFMWPGLQRAKPEIRTLWRTGSLRAGGLGTTRGL